MTPVTADDVERIAAGLAKPDGFERPAMQADDAVAALAETPLARLRQPNMSELCSRLGHMPKSHRRVERLLIAADDVATKGHTKRRRQVDMYVRTAFRTWVSEAVGWDSDNATEHQETAYHALYMAVLRRLGW